MMSERQVVKGKCEFHSPIASIIEYTDILQWKVIFVNFFGGKRERAFNNAFTKL